MMENSPFNLEFQQAMLEEMYRSKLVYHRIEFHEQIGYCASFWIDPLLAYSSASAWEMK
jgi:hypothetical protein